ncbi:MAG: glycosyltransferase family 4 protein [Tepidisphaeraceae bacterium]|jgi:glycosyltransferase involved in cell wall biosynthesis
MDPAKPLRILHLTAASEAGGLSRYILDLCQGLHDRGHQVAVAGGRGAWHEKFAQAPWPWIDLPLNGGPMRLWLAGRELRRYLAEHVVDVVHTHYRRTTLVARRAMRPGNPPILHTVHLPEIPLAGPRGWFSDFGDYVHAPSAGVVRWLAECAQVPRERITLIPHGVNISRFPRRNAAVQAAARAELGLSPDATIAAFVGRLDTPKNADWLLDVAESARGPLRGLKILVAGDGPDAAGLRQAIAQKQLTGSVILLGERDPLPVYQAADALLLPSLREGFGLVCAEAMCVGVSVLRTRTAGTEELIVENVTGRSCAIDRKTFAAAALEFLGDRESLARMGTAAAQHIRHGFSLDTQIERTIELYRTITARQAGQAQRT